MRHTREQIRQQHEQAIRRSAVESAAKVVASFLGLKEEAVHRGFFPSQVVVEVEEPKVRAKLIRLLRGVFGPTVEIEAYRARATRLPPQKFKGGVLIDVGFFWK